MWTHGNPVNAIFGDGQFEKLPELIAGRCYAPITYRDAPFSRLATELEAAAGAPALKIDDVAPNPDFELLRDQSARFSACEGAIEVIVALQISGFALQIRRAAFGGGFSRLLAAFS